MVLGAAVAALLLLFHRDAGDMVRIWIESSTFNHCALIVPIIAWLVWQRRRELGQLRARAWTGGSSSSRQEPCLAVGWAASVALARHLGLVSCSREWVVACLGKAWAAPRLSAVLRLLPGAGRRRDRAHHADRDCA